MKKAAQYMVVSLALSAVLVFICVCIRPAGLAANDGLSYFGSYKTTFVPYLLAFGVCAYCYWMAADELHKTNVQIPYVQGALRIMAVLFLGLVVTPHTIVDPIHIIFGSTLFVLQLLLAVWLSIRFPFRTANWGLVLALFLAGLASLYYVVKPRGLLLQAQVIFQVVFSMLLIKILSRKATTRN